jgi:hypothetical protein
MWEVSIDMNSCPYVKYGLQWTALLGSYEWMNVCHVFFWGVLRRMEF